MEKVRREAGSVQPTSPSRESEAEPAATFRPTTMPAADGDDTESLAGQLDSLRDELAAVKRELESARNEFAATADELRRGLEDLNRQLGN
jgi:hypothetical protein